MLSQALLTHASVLSKFYNYCIPHSSGYLASTDGLLSYQAKLLQWWGLFWHPWLDRTFAKLELRQDVCLYSSFIQPAQNAYGWVIGNQWEDIKTHFLMAAPEWWEPLKWWALPKAPERHHSAWFQKLGRARGSTFHRQSEPRCGRCTDVSQREKALPFSGLPFQNLSRRGSSLVVQCLGCSAFTAMAQVQSLAREPRSCKPSGYLHQRGQNLTAVILLLILLTGFTSSSFSSFLRWELVVVQLLSHVQLFVTPWPMVCQASLSCTISQSLLKLMSIALVMPSNHLILCCPLLLQKQAGIELDYEKVVVFFF